MLFANNGLPALTVAGADLRTRGDLGYEGAAGTVTAAFKKPQNGGLPLVQQKFNIAHNRLRATAPWTTFEYLSGSPARMMLHRMIGQIQLRQSGPYRCFSLS
ncbi:hypothetical protein [Paractinoplanes rishiriensis]|uniref:Uncharacterized protein n=1 Tax=Paractinoplanes rishiriensis TaxID=1050105 RepID=A0A919K9X7_9ACTN|nr:hypothetical protein [Actinoplanes rishiriensis]GIF01561.1 hypothetical protein Ari01nite_90250 [Actinoplanes rishiriensis]